MTFQLKYICTSCEKEQKKSFLIMEPKDKHAQNIELRSYWNTEGHSTPWNKAPVILHINVIETIENVIKMKTK